MDKYKQGFVVDWAYCPYCGFTYESSPVLRRLTPAHSLASPLKEDLSAEMETLHDRIKPECLTRQVVIGYQSVMIEDV